ncbi:helix-turn-helix domain-containing protein [Cupriavidus metallidurans]|uniref:helix-turn-helix domain-containing protein n=1 Tax=Cupriavidus metallidurans TaxID=119219 RepID=UPI00131A41D4|nr:helix-turn-helix transcriptional regulator [Cupriavidus metallidurans]
MTQPRRTHFGARLKQARLKKRLAVRQLAKRSGVDFKSIYRYEDADTSPNIEAAAALALTLDCSLDWLCGLGEESGDTALQQKEWFGAYWGMFEAER